MIELVSSAVPAAIRTELRAHDVEFLFVSDADLERGQVLVYLHENAGLDQQATAIAVLSALAGVDTVEVSAAAWTILVVLLARSDRRRLVSCS